LQKAAAAASITDLDTAMEELLHSQDEQPVFLHPTWLRSWMAEFGSDCEPVLLTATNSALLGVAPLMRCDDRLTFIGDPEICDFMDFLVAPGTRLEPYESLWGQLRDEEWTEMDLWGLPESSPTREALAALAKASGYGVVVEPEAVAPRVSLPDTWEAYLASLGKKDRHELRRKIRRIFDSGAAVSLDVFSEQRDVVANMDTFLTLHTQSRQDKTDFMTPDMESFFRRMASSLAAEGLVHLFMLRINHRPAAAVLCFDAGSVLYLYNSGYDPEFSGLAVGLVSKALCIQWAIENGKKHLDFLRGNESYKYDLGARDRQIFRLRVSRP
jgi:CelD/BcsL family acetyltransferase involved in cellulose biosynthesis